MVAIVIAGPPTATPSFTGPSMSSASVIAGPSSPNGGQQFNAPISAALLLNGNVVVGNADQDLMVNDAGTNENLLFQNLAHGRYRRLEATRRRCSRCAVWNCRRA